MTPDEVLALAQVIARQQLEIANLEAALRHAEQQVQRLEAAREPAEPAQ